MNAYEYATTRAEIINNVNKPCDVPRPEGEGWELYDTANVVFNANWPQVVFVWRRTVRHPPAEPGWQYRSVGVFPNEPGKYVVEKKAVGSPFVMTWPGNKASQLTWKKIIRWYGPIPWTGKSPNNPDGNTPRLVGGSRHER